MAVVGPTGGVAMLMSDSGGPDQVFGVNLTFDDGAADALPDEDQITSGIFKPTNHGLTSLCPVEANQDTFPNGGPGVGPFPTSLAIFTTLNPNGVWKLYVVDDCLGDDGQISQGWSVTINVRTSVLLVSFRALPVGRGISVRWSTRSETDLAGFNVYRSTPARARTKSNRRLISARSRIRGARYVLWDAGARAGMSYTYHLQAVTLDGKKSWVGATTARR